MINRLTYLIAFYLVCGNIYSQHSELKGIVSVKNSKFLSGQTIYVSNASVFDEDQKAQRTVTGKNGDFRLVFVNVKESESVSFSVTKENLQVVNIDALNAVAGQKEIIRIIMADPKVVADFRKEIYKVGKTENEKYLGSKINKLSKELTIAINSAKADKTLIADLKTKIADLELQLTKTDERANEFADYYTAINLDDADPTYQNAFRLFQSGDLNGALKVLELDKLQKRVDISLERAKEVKRLQEAANKLDSVRNAKDVDLINSLTFALDLHKTKYDLDKIAECYRMLFELDDNNVQYFMGYADAKVKLNDDEVAIAAYKKAVSLTTNDSLIAEIKTNLGEIYQKRGEFRDAEMYFNESLEIQKKIYTINPQQNKDNLVSANVKLGNLYLENKQYGKAKEYAGKALMQQTDGNENISDHNSELYSMLSMLSLYKNELSEGKESLLNSIELLKKQIKADPENTRRQLVRSISLLARCFYNDNDIVKAKRYFNEAHEYYSALKPEYSQDVLALLLWTESEFELYQQNEDRAFELFNESLDIYKKLAAKNPAVYESPYADLKIRLADYYNNKMGKKDEALAVLNEADDVYRKLYNRDSVAYGGQYAYLKTRLANLEAIRQHHEKALQLYNEAVSIILWLSKENPEFYQESLAVNYHIRAIQLYNMGQVDKAREDFESSLAILDSIKEKSASLSATRIYAQTYYGVLLQNVGEAEDALLQFTSAKNKLELLVIDGNQKHIPDLATVYYNIATVYEYKTDYIRAERELSAALTTQEKVTKIDKRPFQVTLLFEMARVQGQLGKTKQSEEALTKSIILQRELIASDKKYETFLATLLFTQSNVLSNKPDYENAGILLEEAITILEDKLKDNTANQDFYIQLLSNRANLYKINKEYDESEKYLMLALENLAVSSLPDDVKIFNQAYLLQSLAGLMVERNKFDKAEESYNKAITSLSDIKSHPKAANLAIRLNLNLANMYAIQKKADQTILFVEKAISQQELITGEKPKEESPNLAEYYWYAGNCYRITGKYKEANNLYDKAVAVQLKLVNNYPGYTYFLITIYRSMLENYAAQKDYVAMDSVFEKIGASIKTLPNSNTNQALLAQIYLDYHGYCRLNGRKDCSLIVSKALDIATKLVRTEPDNYTNLLINANVEYAFFWEAFPLPEYTDKYITKADTLASAFYSSTHKMAPFQRIWVCSQRIRIKSQLLKFQDVINISLNILPLVREMAKKDPPTYQPYLTPILGYLGQAYTWLGKTKEARSTLMEGIDVQKSLCTKNGIYEPFLVMLYEYKAQIEFLEFNTEAYTDTMKEAVSIQEKLVKQNTIYANYLVKLYEDAGLRSDILKSYEFAERMWENALITSKQYNITGFYSSLDDHLSFLETNLAKTLRNNGKPEDALKLFFHSNTYLDEQEDKQRIILLYFEIGLTYEMDNNHSLAQDYFKKAKKIYNSLPRDSKDEDFEKELNDKINK
ncbi:tetratricopeptide repeat protein [Flavobacterium hauense]